MATAEQMKTTEALVRREFGAVEEARSGDVSIEGAAAQAKAQIQARYIMAMENRRNMDQVRLDLLQECSRPSFANDPSSLYSKPVGGNNRVEGLGIRFAEVAARCMTNILCEAPTVYEDEKRRHVRVTVTDLEKNVTYMKDIVVVKTVERKSLKEGEEFISVRTNSQNQMTFTVPATEDALLNKEGAMISKATRTGVLRLVPGDLQDECEKKIKDIRAKSIKENPDEAKRKVLDAFASFGVKVMDLEEVYLGHPIEQCTNEEISNLQALYGALKDGEVTWKSVVENADEMKKLRRKAKTTEKVEETKGAEALKQKVADEEAAKKTAAAAQKKEEEEIAKKKAAAEKFKQVAAEEAAKKKAAKVEKEKAEKVEKKPEPEITFEPDELSAGAEESDDGELAPEDSPFDDADALPAEDKEAVQEFSVDIFNEEVQRLGLIQQQVVALFGAAPEELSMDEVGDAITRMKASSAAIRGVLFPLSVTAGDKPTEEQKNTMKELAKKLGVSPEKTSRLWLKTELNDLNAEAVLALIAAMKTYVKK